MNNQYCPFCKVELYQSDSNIDGFDKDNNPIKIDKYECMNDNRLWIVKHGEGIGGIL
jgi:hypothetical protein